MTRAFRVDRLRVSVAADPAHAGVLAAAEIGAALAELTASLSPVRVVFAAAPSQTAMLTALRDAPDVDWRRVQAYQMDEYLGLPHDAAQGFGNWLRRSIFDHLPVTFHPMLDGADYLDPAEVDLVCLGIGENGHLAFNDPPAARFDDEMDIRTVELDLSSREQQVHDGLFGAVDEVPTEALTLTIPRLMRSRHVVAVACGPTKTAAVRRTLSGPVAASCPATALRQHQNASLYTDLAAYPV